MQRHVNHLGVTGLLFHICLLKKSGYLSELHENVDDTEKVPRFQGLFCPKNILNESLSYVLG